ncbi:MAG: hypothetical protein WKF29_05505 [Thermoleophilaceae bacterium]
MKRIAALRPTPATAIACLALFVSLGGVSYGVATGTIDSREIQDETVQTQDIRDETVQGQDIRDETVEHSDVAKDSLRSGNLRNDSIRTQDLRNNEIRGLDIRNSTIRGIEVALDSLDGSDIFEPGLAQVPSAANADTLDGLDSTDFMRATPAPTQPQSFKQTARVASGGPPPQFEVDPMGYVHLLGTSRASGNAAAPLVVLPRRARPASVRRFAVYSDPARGRPAATLVKVEPDGDVRLVGRSAAGDKISLDGIVFHAGG